jgi:hypothetical protein
MSFADDLDNIDEREFGEFMDKIHKDQTTVEHLIKWTFNTDGLFVNDLERACIMTALRLTLRRKYPILDRFPLLRFFPFLWLELREFLSYETGKYYVKFRPMALKKLG